MSKRESRTGPPGSDRPDLRAEREAFVRSFLRKGVELTEELLKENQELQREYRKLEEENLRLRNQIASDGAIRDLLERIDRLEGERNNLMSRSNELEVSSRKHDARSRQVEQELNDLASLYVAAYQLSASLSPRKVIKQICELVEQLVGGERFALYLISADEGQALPLDSRGYEPGELGPMALADGPMADVVLTGTERVQDDPANRIEDVPLALVPLTVNGQTIAIIVLENLLPHKHAWASVDAELFRLLGTLGATALIAANLYSDAHTPGSALSTLKTKLDSKDAERAMDPAAADVGV